VHRRLSHREAAALYQPAKSIDQLLKGKTRCASQRLAFSPGRKTARADGDSTFNCVGRCWHRRRVRRRRRRQVTAHPLHRRRVSGDLERPAGIGW